MGHVRSLLLGLFVLVVGCATLTEPPVTVKTTAPVDQALASTIVLLGKEAPFKWKGLICAGVYVGRNYILTAHHCAVPSAFTELDQTEAEAEEVPLNPLGQVVSFVNRTPWLDSNEEPRASDKISGVVIADDDANDLSLIKTDQASPTYVIVAGYDPVVSQAVFTIGHPSGLSYSYSKGYISNTSRSLGDDSPDYMQTNLSVWHGNSGGGLFDEQGRLVGICSAMLSRQPSISFFVSIRPIRAILTGVMLF